MIRLYDELEKRLPPETAGEFYTKREEKFLLSASSATVEKIFELDEYVRPLFEKYFKHKRIWVREHLFRLNRLIVVIRITQVEIGNSAGNSHFFNRFVPFFKIAKLS